ncbi:MAG: CHAD domain-containing protein [Candidatus Ozemobacteraceae bacterium]
MRYPGYGLELDSEDKAEDMVPAELFMDFKEVGFFRELLVERGSAFVKQVRRLQRNWTPDAIHDVRVACRRFQSGIGSLEAFLDPGALRSSKRMLKEFMKAFNILRDCDVHLEMLAGIRKSSSALVNEGVQQLKELFLVRKKALDRKAKKMVRETRNNLEITVPPLRDDLCVSAGGNLLQVLVPEVHQVMTKCREIVWEKPAETLISLHALRIQIKRLRYGLEMFASRIGDEGKKIFQQLKTLQDLLGWIHDYDTLGLKLKESLVRTMKKQYKEVRKCLKNSRWPELEASFFHRMQRSNVPEAMGIIYLLQNILKRRKSLFHSAQKKLETMEKNHWFPDLIKHLKPFESSTSFSL